jgi:uncharacterized membrane protein
VTRQPVPTIAQVRERLGCGRVFSLETFIAADLLRTIPSPTLESGAVIGVIALLRISLSLSLEYGLRHLPMTPAAGSDGPPGAPWAE